MYAYIQNDVPDLAVVSICYGLLPYRNLHLNEDKIINSIMAKTYILTVEFLLNEVVKQIEC